MRISGVMFLSLMLTACTATVPRDERESQGDVYTLRGVHDIRIFGPGTLTWAALESDEPALRVECHADTACTFSLVEDVDGNGEPGPAEEREMLPLTAVPGGYIVLGVRLSAERRARFQRPLAVLEFASPEGKQLHVRTVQ